MADPSSIRSMKRERNQDEGPAPQVVPTPSSKARHKAAPARRAAHGNGVGAVSVILLAACHALDRAVCMQCARIFAD